jgi:hypothetical protein
MRLIIIIRFKEKNNCYTFSFLTRTEVREGLQALLVRDGSYPCRNL